MYNCVIVKTEEIINHPNADKLNILKWNGTQIIVDKTLQVGELVAIFLTDGQLSTEFCSANNLFSSKELNKDTTQTGYIGKNGKVKAIKLRGEFSNGLALPISCFDYIPGVKLEEGMEFSELNGHFICQKFITVATRNASKKEDTKNWKTEYSLIKHYDTENIYKFMDKLPEKSLLIITEKVHGTSARTGNVKVFHRSKNIFHRLLGNILHKSFYSEKTNYEYVSGTRNTILNTWGEVRPDNKDYYRRIFHDFFVGKLHKGETIYYEIVGKDSYGGFIMSPQHTHELKDKAIEKLFGEKIEYLYESDDEHPQVIYVYRITQETTDGNIHELSWFEIKKRCKELEVKNVPELVVEYFHSEYKDYIKIVEKNLLTNSKSTIGNNLMEGIVYRFEHEDSIDVYKSKNQVFLILEGVLKENPEFVDTEEAS